MKDRSRLAYQATEIAYSVIVIAWYVLPYLLPSVGGYNPLLLANILYGSPPRQPGPWLAITAITWIIPVLCVWKIAAVFLRQRFQFITDPRTSLAILVNVVSSGLVIALLIFATHRYIKAK